MRSNAFSTLRSVGVVALFSLSLALPLGCGYSNPHGEQDTPPILRLWTVPAGATVILADMNLKLETPCDLPTELDPDDEISISKAGYLPYKGPLSGLPEVGRGTYQIELVRVGTAPPEN
jgi:hypothetical protein